MSCKAISGQVSWYMAISGHKGFFSQSQVLLVFSGVLEKYQPALYLSLSVLLCWNHYLGNASVFLGRLLSTGDWTNLAFLGIVVLLWIATNVRRCYISLFSLTLKSEADITNFKTSFCSCSKPLNLTDVLMDAPHFSIFFIRLTKKE